MSPFRRDEGAQASELRELRQVLAEVQDDKMCPLCRTRKFQIEQLPHQGVVLGAPDLTVCIPTIPEREKSMRPRAVLSAKKGQLLRPRQVLLHVDTKKEGAELTRKRLLTGVKTPYVAFFDDDDEMQENHLFMLMNELVASGKDRVYSCHLDCLTPEEDECPYCSVSTFVARTRAVDSVFVRKLPLRTWVKHQHEGQTGGRL